MKTFLKDFEEKSFSNKDELHSFAQKRAETDVWAEPIINTLKVGGIPLNSSDKIEEVRASYPNLVATDEAIAETMNPDVEGMGLLLSYPTPDNDNVMTTRPLRYTAHSALFERAGISGKTMRNTDEKKLITPLDPEVKAEILNTCLSCYADSCKVLLRDGKISTVRSSRYEVLNAYELISELELSIGSEYADFKMNSACVSHEYLTVDYEIVDLALSARLMKIASGSIATSASLLFRFQTSDVGNSTAKITPVLLADGKKSLSV